MLASGTFSAPILRSSIPAHKMVLRPRVTCKVKDTLVPNQYDLYARTCADGSTQRENIDFTDSYSLVASIDSICLLLNLAASKGLLISIMDISNASKIVSSLMPLNGYTSLFRLCIWIGFDSTGWIINFLLSTSKIWSFNASNVYRVLEMRANNGANF